MRHNILGGLFCLIASLSLAQTPPQIALRLSFNAEQNRYEVLARPTFSARNFIWGPTQISVVVPDKVANETISIRSLEAGSWADNSVVYRTDADFHGISSQGGKLDLVAGQDYRLFDFSLKSGYVENVRLFNAAKDPNSSEKGMRGGDFRIYMADERGVDYLQVDTKPAALSALNETGTEAVVEANQPTQVVAYPNPNTGGKFRLYLKGFTPDETVTVRLVDGRGVVLRSFSEKVDVLAGREIEAGSGTTGYLLLTLERPANQEQFTRKLLFR